MLQATSLPPATTVVAVAGVLTSLLTVVGIRVRSAIGADWFALTMGAATAWIGLAVATPFAGTAETVLLFELLVTVLSISVPVFWFAFVLEYTGRGHLLTPRSLAALWAVPGVAVALILTTRWNDLYFRAPVMADLKGYPAVHLPHGPWAWLTLAYLVALFTVGFWLLLATVRDHDDLFSGQAVWLVSGTLAPLVVGLFQALRLVPDRAPLIPASLSVLGVAYAYSLFRHRLFDVLPATRRIGAEEAFDDLGEGVVIVSTDRVVVGINRCACRQFDCERERVLGADLDAVSSDLSSVGPADGPVDVEHGRSVFEVSTSTVADARGRRTGHALVVRDVTEQRSRKQRLAVLNRVLRHNLRNDMTVVQGYAEEIAARDDGDLAEMATAIDDTSERLLELAAKARAVERTVTTAGTEERTVDVGDVVAAVLAEFAETAPQVDVAFDRGTDLRVAVDVATLELVVSNVVENAVRHGVDAEDDGGGNGADAPDVRVRATREFDGVKVTVADDGPGIPEEELAVIERGTETALEHGSGLGLWLVKWGTTRMGARLAFDTTGGTTVELFLPDE